MSFYLNNIKLKYRLYDNKTISIGIKKRHILLIFSFYNIETVRTMESVKTKPSETRSMCHSRLTLKIKIWKSYISTGESEKSVRNI